MTTYTIKPLVWVQSRNWEADAGDLFYEVFFFDGSIYVTGLGGVYSTIEEAKAAAEEHYRNRVLEFLEEVK